MPSTPPAVRAARKIYTETERAKARRDRKEDRTGESIKAAVKKAGISEQTYYQWKKAAGQTIPSDELKDLLKLEEENTRLKKLLADRLRNENAEHRKARGSLESSPGHVESFTSGRMPFCCPLSVATL
jgi:putative transposase